MVTIQVAMIASTTGFPKTNASNFDRFSPLIDINESASENDVTINQTQEVFYGYA